MDRIGEDSVPVVEENESEQNNGQQHAQLNCGANLDLTISNRGSKYTSSVHTSLLVIMHAGQEQAWTGSKRADDCSARCNRR